MEDLEIRNYSIIKIAYDIEKSPSPVTQTPVRNHQLTIMRKNLKRVKW